MVNIFSRIDNWLVRNTSVPLTQKVFFTENLRVMIHAGLSMSEALNTLAMQSESKSFRKIITTVKEDVESGKSLSAGLSKYPRSFPDIYRSMIQVGEISGTLENVLEELTQQMKKDHKLRTKVRGAMTYPIVILIAMVGITIGLLVFVLPKLLGIFKEFGDTVQLPLATKMLITTSDFVQNNGILTAVIIIATVMLFMSAIRIPIGKKIFHWILLKGPIIGPISKKVNLARFSRTLSGLLRTDIPVVQSLEITSQVVGNIHYHNAILDTSEKIKKGATIAESMETHKNVFPPLVVQMTFVGERSGNVDDLLADVADFYEAQVDQVLDNMSSIIEPVLILILAGMVGGIALAVITPMYTLTEAIAES
ncbi:MAG: type II secretion system F family protein [Patescibacteria group bacterium]|nr:type II secretion system F family protein [Patescibacteria group bacterium]